MPRVIRLLELTATSLDRMGRNALPTDALLGGQSHILVTVSDSTASFGAKMFTKGHSMTIQGVRCFKEIPDGSVVKAPIEIPRM